MNLLELKQATELELKKRTKDDLYTNLWVKDYRQFFCQKAGLKDEKEIEPFLVDYLKEIQEARTKSEAQEFFLKGEAFNFLFETLLFKSYKEPTSVDGSSHYLEMTFDDTEVLSYWTNKQETFPNNWKEIIQKILSFPIAKISGVLSSLEANRGKGFTTHLNKRESQFSNEDFAYLLALKIAVKSNEFLSIGNNTIILTLSGGVSAKIKMRKQGKFISEFQKEEVELYLNLLGQKDNRVRDVELSLYSQKGYVDSRVVISAPVGYYILGEGYVVEIAFFASPVLLNGISLGGIVPDRSSQAKKEDDEKARDEMMYDD